MVRQVDQQIISLRPERSDQSNLLHQSVPQRQSMGSLNGMDLSDRRMILEHLSSFAEDERVDLEMGGMILQHLEERRGQQHISVMPKLDHQDTTNCREIH